MKVLCFGSLNYDKVYEVDHFVMPKETLSSISYMETFGGKGANQSIALKKAGVDVYHGGKVGKDGNQYLNYLKELGINIDYIDVDNNTVTGHAIIQNSHGENCIIIHGGANQEIDEALIDKVLNHFNQGDILLLQNEISSMCYLITKAHEKGLKIVFNAAPMDDKVFTYPLEYVDLLLVNEIEGKALAKISEDDFDSIIKGLQKSFPNQDVLLTCGKDGAYYLGKEIIYQEAFPVKAVDTTAAGDTFTGYFLACMTKEMSVKDAMKVAAKASSITVLTKGAATSIPLWDDVIKSME